MMRMHWNDLQLMDASWTLELDLHLFFLDSPLLACRFDQAEACPDSWTVCMASLERMDMEHEPEIDEQ